MKPAKFLLLPSPGSLKNIRVEMRNYKKCNKLDNLFRPIVTNTLNFLQFWRFGSICVTKVGSPFRTCRTLPLNSKKGPKGKGSSNFFTWIIFCEKPVLKNFCTWIYFHKERNCLCIVSIKESAHLILSMFMTSEYSLIKLMTRTKVAEEKHSLGCSLSNQIHGTEKLLGLTKETIN